MATFQLTLSGDQIGTYTTLSGNGNGVERIVTLGNVTALGTSDEVFTIVVEQAADGETQFRNGQFVTILDSSGNVVMARTGVQPDAEQGLGAGDEQLIIQSTGFVIDTSGLNPGPEQVQYGFTDEVSTSTDGDNDGELDFLDLQGNFPCFGRGTLIKTPKGERSVESLKDGDLVSTTDNGAQAILWIHNRQISLEDHTEQLHPVLISTDAFSAGQPSLDLVLSPQHCVYFGPDTLGNSLGRLLPATGLTGIKGVRRMKGKNP